MANEEQRKAFASYMGAAATSNGQNGATSSPTNPYLYNVWVRHCATYVYNLLITFF